MSPDARLRMEVYQEGQRAFDWKLACPYASLDWRAGTWQKGFNAAKAHYFAQLQPGPEPVKPPSDADRIAALERRVAELEQHIQRLDARTDPHSFYC